MTLNLGFFTPWLDNVEDPIPVTPTIDREESDETRGSDRGPQE